MNCDDLLPRAETRKKTAPSFFLVADTGLYTLLRQSIGRLVSPSVGWPVGMFFSKYERFVAILFLPTRPRLGVRVHDLVCSPWFFVKPSIFCCCLNATSYDSLSESIVRSVENIPFATSFCVSAFTLASPPHKNRRTSLHTLKSKIWIIHSNFFQEVFFWVDDSSTNIWPKSESS